MDIPKPKFEFTQRVLASSGKEGYVCGILYYVDLRKWHYAVTVDPQKLIHDEIWHEESELSPVEG